jgi:hypothetical protein
MMRAQLVESNYTCTAMFVSRRAEARWDEQDKKTRFLDQPGSGALGRDAI